MFAATQRITTLCAWVLATSPGRHSWMHGYSIRNITNACFSCVLGGLDLTKGSLPGRLQACLPGEVPGGAGCQGRGGGLGCLGTHKGRTHRGDPKLDIII